MTADWRRLGPNKGHFLLTLLKVADKKWPLFGLILNSRCPPCNFGLMFHVALHPKMLSEMANTALMVPHHSKSCSGQHILKSGQVAQTMGQVPHAIACHPGPSLAPPVGASGPGPKSLPFGRLVTAHWEDNPTSNTPPTPPIPTPPPSTSHF